MGIDNATILKPILFPPHCPKYPDPAGGIGEEVATYRAAASRVNQLADLAPLFPDFYYSTGYYFTPEDDNRGSGLLKKHDVIVEKRMTFDLPAS